MASSYAIAIPHHRSIASVVVLLSLLPARSSSFAPVRQSPSTTRTATTSTTNRECRRSRGSTSPIHATKFSWSGKKDDEWSKIAAAPDITDVIVDDVWSDVGTSGGGRRSITTMTGREVDANDDDDENHISTTTTTTADDDDSSTRLILVGGTALILIAAITLAITMGNDMGIDMDLA